MPNLQWMLRDTPLSQLVTHSSVSTQLRIQYFGISHTIFIIIYKWPCFGKERIKGFLPVRLPSIQLTNNNKNHYNKLYRLSPTIQPWSSIRSSSSSSSPSRSPTSPSPWSSSPPPSSPPRNPPGRTGTRWGRGWCRATGPHDPSWTAGRTGADRTPRTYPQAAAVAALSLSSARPPRCTGTCPSTEIASEMTSLVQAQRSLQKWHLQFTHKGRFRNDIFSSPTKLTSEMTSSVHWHKNNIAQPQADKRLSSTFHFSLLNCCSSVVL